MRKRRLLFISPRFLFPVDSGGKIRTTGILREMKGGTFEITLVSPAPPTNGYEDEMAQIADHWFYWSPVIGWQRKLKRVAGLFSSLPVSVAGETTGSARDLIAARVADGADLAVFDFAHAAALAPADIPIPSVMFTHNIESEIFARHESVASNWLMKGVWHSQLKKMRRFEADNLQRFDKVIAVSDRDRAGFESEYKLDNVETIPTGVDLSFFEYAYEPEAGKVVFTGSMDWLANQDGIEFFMDEIWPLIVARQRGATMCVVGRSAPESLVSRSARFGQQWCFTGFVDDVRDYMHGASVYVIPLRVGGGTRLKVFEAMASGCPVVSTAIGVEGLDVIDRQHYLCAETPEEFAEATVRLLTDSVLARELSMSARRFVEENASNASVAKRFEEICELALHNV